jgi:hypothetical protein
MIRFFGVYEAFSVSSNNYGLAGQAGNPQDLMSLITEQAAADTSQTGAGGASGVEGLNVTKGQTGRANWAAIVLENFKIRVMRRATKVFLSTMMSRIPWRTGFLAGSFYKHNQAFNPERSAQSNRIVDIGLGANLGTEENPIAEKKVRMRLKDFFQAIRESKDIDYTDPKTGRKRKSGSAKKYLDDWDKLQEDQEAIAKKKRIYDQKMRIRRQLLLRKKNAARKAAGLRYGKGNITRPGGEYYYHGRGRASRIRKTPRSGVQFALPEDPAQILQFTEGGQAVLTVGNAIRYFAVMDNRGRGGAPWGAMRAAKTATENYIRQAIRKYKFITEVVAKSKIVLTADGNITISPAGNLMRDGGTMGQDVSFLTPAASAKAKTPKPEKMGPPKPKKDTMRRSIDKEAKERQATLDAHKARLAQLRRRVKRKLTPAEREARKAKYAARKKRMAEETEAKQIAKYKREQMIRERAENRKYKKRKKRKD